MTPREPSEADYEWTRRELSRVVTELEIHAARLKECESKLAVARDCLGLAKQKLEIYREHSNGEYQGGMEYTSLMYRINTALENVYGAARFNITAILGGIDDPA